MADNSSQLKSDAIFEQLKLHLSTDAGEGLIKKIGLVYQINIAPKKIGFNEKFYVVDLRKGEVKEGKYEDGKPDATFSFTDNDFVKIATGKMNPQIAFMRGAMKIKGSISAAQKFTPDIFPKPSKILAGDFGFDPLGLGEDPASLRWYVQAELVHARFAMAGVAGILFTDLLRLTGTSDLPVWYEAGATQFDFASTRTLIIIQLLLMGFVETKRYMDFLNPGSQAKPGSFFGLEAALEGLEPGYPGGPLLNPLGIARDIKNANDWKLKEIKNGRLAMVAMLGIFVQASVTHVGPIDNLIEHLSNPWHKTIIQTISASSSRSLEHV